MKYEYKTRRIYADGLEFELNRAGADGWHVVFIEPRFNDEMGNYYFVVLERAI